LLLLWIMLCCSMLKSAGGKCLRSRSRTSYGGFSFCHDNELSWCFVTWSSDIVSWASEHEKFTILTLSVKIQASRAFVCSWQWPC
jgi:hypothetical protein